MPLKYQALTPFLGLAVPGRLGGAAGRVEDGPLVAGGAVGVAGLEAAGPPVDAVGEPSPTGPSNAAFPAAPARFTMTTPAAPARSSAASAATTHHLRSRMDILLTACAGPHRTRCTAG